MEVSASYVRFEGEEYVFGFVRDIAARRQAEDALRASEARFRRLFETVSVAVLQSDLRGRVLMANPAALHLLGCGSLAELLDASLPDFLADPRELDPLARRLRTRARSPTPRSC